MAESHNMIVMMADRHREDVTGCVGDDRVMPPSGTPFGGFLQAFLHQSGSEGFSRDQTFRVNRAYCANVAPIDAAIGRILDALSVEAEGVHGHSRGGVRRLGDLDRSWLIYATDQRERLGDRGLLTKIVFYDAAEHVPPIRRPTGRCRSQVVDSLVEQIDISVLIRSIAQAPSADYSAGRTLALFGCDEPGRIVSVTKNHGFVPFETGEFKLVVHEDDPSWAQFFNKQEDPLESENVCEDLMAWDGIVELMDRNVGGFFSPPACRPHEPAFG